jgi:hypothetical protein
MRIFPRKLRFEMQMPNVSPLLRITSSQQCMTATSSFVQMTTFVDLGFKGSYDRIAAFARQRREGQTEWGNSARKRTNWPRGETGAHAHRLHLGTGHNLHYLNMNELLYF